MKEGDSIGIGVFNPYVTFKLKFILRKELR